MDDKETFVVKGFQDENNQLIGAIYTKSGVKDGNKTTP